MAFIVLIEKLTQVKKLATDNQQPERAARDQVDRQLRAAGWVLQDKKSINQNTQRGVTIRGFATEVRLADYALSKRIEAENAAAAPKRLRRSA